MLPRHGSVGTSDKCAHLADLTRNGMLETIFVTQTPTSMGRVVVVTPRRTKIWHHDFKEIPWEDTGHVTSGMVGLYSGKFTSIDHADLLVTVHWGTGHGGYQSFLLRGTDGIEIWHCVEGGKPPLWDSWVLDECL